MKIFINEYYQSQSREESMMRSMTVKLDDETYDRLKALREARKRTLHGLMKEAINRFLDSRGRIRAHPARHLETVGTLRDGQARPRRCVA